MTYLFIQSTSSYWDLTLCQASALAVVNKHLDYRSFQSGREIDKLILNIIQCTNYFNGHFPSFCLAPLWCSSKIAFPFFLKHPRSMTSLVSLPFLRLLLLSLLCGLFSTWTVRSWHPLGPVLSPLLSLCPMLFLGHLFHFGFNGHLSASLARAALSSRPSPLVTHRLLHINTS